MWRFLRNRRLLLCLHTIFRALIYWAHRAVVLAIAWRLVYRYDVSHQVVPLYVWEELPFSLISYIVTLVSNVFTSTYTKLCLIITRQAWTAADIIRVLLSRCQCLAVYVHRLCSLSILKNCNQLWRQEDCCICQCCCCCCVLVVVKV